MLKDQIEERISKLKENSKQPTGKVLQNVDVKACLSDLHNKYVFVPADKAPSNIIIICKMYYIGTLIKELGLDNFSIPTGNSTYTSCQMSSEDIVNTRDTFMRSLGIELSDDDKRLPYLYWTPKLQKSPVKHCLHCWFQSMYYKTVVEIVNQSTYSHKDWTIKIL